MQTTLNPATCHELSTLWMRSVQGRTDRLHYPEQVGFFHTLVCGLWWQRFEHGCPQTSFQWGKAIHTKVDNFFARQRSKRKHWRFVSTLSKTCRGDQWGRHNVVFHKCDCIISLVASAKRQLHSLHILDCRAVEGTSPRLRLQWCLFNRYHQLKYVPNQRVVEFSF